MNRGQLVVLWMAAILVSVFLVIPIIRTDQMAVYRSEDGWTWELQRVPFGAGYVVLGGGTEGTDEKGVYRFTGQPDSDGKARRYYFSGVRNKYGLDLTSHPYERLIAVALLNGVLLFFTLGRTTVQSHRS